MSQAVDNTCEYDGVRLDAQEIEKSGACKVQVKVNGFRVNSNILLSALPTARERETLLVRFDLSADQEICCRVMDLLRTMYMGPIQVLRVSDNVTYQGKTSTLSMHQIQSDFQLLRVDNFVYVYNPYDTAGKLEYDRSVR